MMWKTIKVNVNVCFGVLVLSFAKAYSSWTPWIGRKIGVGMAHSVK